MNLVLPIHVAAGGLALVLGAVALMVRKGGTIHRRSGLLFVYAMLVMGLSASILEFLKTPNWANVSVALMTAYFVGTALTTVRPVSPCDGQLQPVGLQNGCKPPRRQHRPPAGSVHRPARSSPGRGRWARRTLRGRPGRDAPVRSSGHADALR